MYTNWHRTLNPSDPWHFAPDSLSSENFSPREGETNYVAEHVRLMTLRTVVPAP